MFYNRCYRLEVPKMVIFPSIITPDYSNGDLALKQQCILLNVVVAAADDDRLKISWLTTINDYNRAINSDGMRVESANTWRNQNQSGHTSDLRLWDPMSYPRPFSKMVGTWYHKNSWCFCALCGSRNGEKSSSSHYSKRGTRFSCKNGQKISLLCIVQ